MLDFPGFNEMAIGTSEITEGTVLAKRLSQLSPYADRIGGICDKVPGIMKLNEQLRPLWDVWCRNAHIVVKPRQVFSKEEARVLRSFFEYLYFSSDAFLNSEKKAR